jgi:hypothetical protein
MSLKLSVIHSLVIVAVGKGAFGVGAGLVVCLARERRFLPSLRTAVTAEHAKPEPVLGDLEVVARKTGEVIEHLGELDASAEAAVESAVAKAAAYEAQDLLDDPVAQP